MKRKGELWIGLLLVGACSQPGGGSDSMSEMTLTASDTSDTTETTSDESDDTDGGPNLGPCANFIACVMDVTPQVLTTMIATYGEEGTCWKGPAGSYLGVKEEDCWAECEALLAELQNAYPKGVAENKRIDGCRAAPRGRGAQLGT